jgi:site-specific recombinase XerD
MTTRGIRERVNYYLGVSGVKQGKARRITAFSLRHTAALILVEQGATAEELMKRLRLGSRMTAEVYLKQKGLFNH